MKRDELHPGDYVEHRSARNTIWEVVAVEPWTPDGGQAKLRWVGGERITYEARLRIFEVYDGGDVALIRDLCPANPMLVIALVSQTKGPPPK